MMAGNINIFNFFEKIKVSLNPFSWLNRIKFNKSNLRILFIDDQDMPVFNNLKKAGWSVEKERDINNMDDDVLRRNHIIFVDYKGVGRSISPKYEGVGLAIQIKKKYGKKKRVIIYSGNRTFSRDTVLESEMKLIDNKLLKYADTTEFSDMIQCEMKKIR